MGHTIPGRTCQIWLGLTLRLDPEIEIWIPYVDKRKEKLRGGRKKIMKKELLERI